jgi:hypothetical protein
MAWFSARKSSARHNRPTSGRRRLTTRLHLEALEDRSVPAIAVTSLLDDGSEGTLRWAVEQANMIAGPDTLTFDPGVSGAISLLQGKITITDDLTIAGPGADELAISVFYDEITETTSGIAFEIIAGATVSLLDLSIDNRADGVIDPLDEEAIFNAGVLSIMNCNFASNNDMGYGGGIFNAGMLTVDNCNFNDLGVWIHNTAGSVMINASSFVSSSGIWNEGTLTVADTTFSDSGIVNVGTVTVVGSAFSNNNPDRFESGVSNYALATVINCTFSGFGFSAIYNPGDLSVIGSTFSNNTSIFGGAIWNENAASATISGSTFTGNRVLSDGGAIYNKGVLSVATSLFSANSVQYDPARFDGIPDPNGGSESGGAIWSDNTLIVNDCSFDNNFAASNGGGIFNAGTATITDSTFTSNDASFWGGAIQNSGELDISGSTFTNNSAVLGGALQISGIIEGMRTDVSSSIFAGNSASFAGGAIRNLGVPLTVSGSSFTNNSAELFGGAIQNLDAPLAISASNLSENTARGAGAVHFTRSSLNGLSQAIFRVDNSTFWRNSASITGGAIIVSDQSSFVLEHRTVIHSLINVTIVENSAGGNGGGIFSGGGNFFAALGVGNSIIAGNVATNTLTSDVLLSSFVSLGNNLFGILGNVPAATTDLWGTVDSPLDPMLAPLGNYGGPTQTMALLPGSPALNAGSVELAVDADGNPLTADQRGLPRVVNGLIDMGACQKQPNAATLEAAVPNAPVVTLETPEGTTLTSVTALAPPPSDQRAGTGLPKNAVLPVGAFDFTVEVAAGATAQIILHLADGTPPINAYYKLNPANGKWFKFNWDAATGTGAILPGEVHPLTGNIVPSNQIVLILKDNARGDSNSTVGIIDDPGGPAYVETLQVQIDVRSTVNLASQGKIAVAILATDDFDPALVDIASVRFAGATAVHSAWEDVNGDGRLDLVLHFRTQDTDLRALYERLIADDINEDGVLDSNRQEATISLTGTTTDNEQFEGTDTIDLFLSGKALRELLSRLVAEGAI